MFQDNCTRPLLTLCFVVRLVSLIHASYFCHVKGLARSSRYRCDPSPHTTSTETLKSFVVLSEVLIFGWAVARYVVEICRVWSSIEAFFLLIVSRNQLVGIMTTGLTMRSSQPPRQRKMETVNKTAKIESLTKMLSFQFRENPDTHTFTDCGENPISITLISQASSYMWTVILWNSGSDYRWRKQSKCGKSLWGYAY